MRTCGRLTHDTQRADEVIVRAASSESKAGVGGVLGEGGTREKVR
jgi:hypothetical protein